MSKKRKQSTAAEKITILRKHLLEGVPVSEICEEYELQPSVFYRWQKTLFEQGAQLFQGRPDKKASQQQQQIEQLNQKLRKKDEVLAEVMEEYVSLKKSSGAT
jgi:transposase-like protein